MLNVDNAFVGGLLSYCHSVTVSSVRYTEQMLCLWSTKRTFFCGTHWCDVMYPIDGGDSHYNGARYSRA